MRTQRTHLWSQPGKERVGHAGTVALTHTSTMCDADTGTHTPVCVHIHTGSSARGWADPEGWGGRGRAAQGEEMHIRRWVHADGQPEPTQQCTATTLR